MQVYGHRGAAGEAPENTIAGCLHAIERGTKFVEVDLRLSSDGQLVIIHDKTLKRTTGITGPVNRKTARELATLDARADGPPWPRKKGCGVPSLDAFLNATRAYEGYQLEVKADSRAAMRRIAAMLAERFNTPRATQGIVVTSSNYQLHEYLRELAPHIPRGMVIMRPDAIANLFELGCTYSVMHWSACNAYTVRSLRKRGVHISTWTVNDAQMIKNLYKMKIDSVITDYPSMALPLVAALER